MFGLKDELSALGKPVTIGIAGIGSIGRGILRQAQTTPGIRCLAIADCDVDRAVAAAGRFRLEYRKVDTLSDLEETVHKGRLAICADGDLVARCDLVNVFIEATNSVTTGGRLGDECA